jgi:tRNA-2-methylthio-N6-dimethylallyladenosine synthase
MSGQIADDVQSQRLHCLQDVIDRHQQSFNEACVGRVFDVLFEKPGRYPGQVVGRSPYLQPVQVLGGTSLIGEIHPVVITEVSANSLFGALAAATRREARPAIAAGA